MNTSPSQLETHCECPRKRWLGSFIRLPDKKDPRKKDIGTILHEVAERWLAADDTGRVPPTSDGKPHEKGILAGQIQGHPVDPFPPDWDRVQERGQSPRRLSPADAALVRKLYKDGLASGVLRRIPNRQLEVWIAARVADNILLRGRIDQRNFRVVEDHKTTGSRKWALTSEDLAKDRKMLCYAAAHFMDFPNLDEVTLRLNYFCKDPREMPNTWAVEAVVTKEQAEKFWNEVVIPQCSEMLHWEETVPTIDRWREVEGPRAQGACKAYGGCPYERLCSGLEREGTMGVFDKKRKSQAAPAPAAEAPQTEAAPAAAAEAQSAPPWAVAGCQACKGTGVSSKGTPCRACDVVSGRTGGPTSSQFKTWIDDDGVFRWVEAQGSTPPEEAPKATTGPSDSKESETSSAGAPAEDTSTPRRRGRPKGSKNKTTTTTEVRVGDISHTETTTVEEQELPLEAPFILLLGCVSEKAHMSLSDILEEEGAEMAKVFGVESYYQIDAFKRRDALAAAAPQIAEKLKAKIVFMAEDTPDLKVLAAALVPYAAVVVRAIR